MKKEGLQKALIVDEHYVVTVSTHKTASVHGPAKIILTRSLYSWRYMRIDLILESIWNIFQAYPDPNRSDEGALELLALTLNNNDFESDSNYYLQTIKHVA